MNYLLFGTGEYYRRYKKWFSEETVLALMDNSPVKQGCVIDEIPVMAPRDAIKLPYDLIIILSFYVREMIQQLTDLGVERGRIYHFYSLHDLFISKKPKKREIHYWEETGISDTEAEVSGNRVLLLSHDLNLGGPALALLQAAIVLKKNGWKVVYASTIDGPLRQRLIQEGISVVVDENLQIQTMKETLWVRRFDLIFCNTINFYVFLSEQAGDIPIIWWLHDSEFFYDGVDKAKLSGMNRENIRIVSVGPVSRRAMQNYLPEADIEDLLYAVEDTEGKK